MFGAAGRSQDPKKAVPPPSVALEVEQYNRIARLIEKKIPVTLEFDIQNKFYRRYAGFLHRDRGIARHDEER